jgi:hypothetical protein
MGPPPMPPPRAKAASNLVLLVKNHKAGVDCLVKGGRRMTRLGADPIERRVLCHPKTLPAEKDYRV